MFERASKKPRFTRIIRDDGFWLRDREESAPKMIGPFDSWAAALAWLKSAERNADEQKKQL